MKISKNLQFVEQMRNIGYLTGFVKQPHKLKNETWHKRQIPGFNGFYLMQTNNIEQAIPIHVPEGAPIPADESPVTVAVHVFGVVDPVTGERTLKITSLDVSRPSIRAMPASIMWGLNSNKKHSNDDFNPFGKGGKLIDQLEKEVDAETDEYSDTEKALQNLLTESKGKLDTRLGSNANVMLLAGFLDSFKNFMPDEHKTKSYWDLHLRQHEKREKCLPVRVYTRDMKAFRSKLKRGSPIAITGQIRVKVTPNDAKDGLPEGIVYIRTDDFSGASRIQDILSVPTWYTKMIEEQAAINKMRREAVEKAKQKSDNENDESEAKSLMDKLTGG